jgi:hypothetical protein
MYTTIMVSFFVILGLTALPADAMRAREIAELQLFTIQELSQEAADTCMAANTQSTLRAIALSPEYKYPNFNMAVAASRSWSQQVDYLRRIGLVLRAKLGYEPRWMPHLIEEAQRHMTDNRQTRCYDFVPGLRLPPALTGRR